MPNIFIVDDDPDILISMQHLFGKRGYTTFCFPDIKSALASMYENIPDIVILDVNLNGEDGRELCKEIKKNAPYDTIVMMFSANPDNLLNPESYDADDVFHKPFEFDELETKIKQFLAGKTANNIPVRPYISGSASLINEAFTDRSVSWKDE